MQFAHLIRCKGSFGESLIVSPAQANTLQHTALLKARTFLSYLVDNNLLAFEQDEKLGWTMYRPSWVNLGPIPMATVSDDVVAVVPAKIGPPAWEQAGIAFVRHDMEVSALFIEWLTDSRKWLKNNPSQLEQLATMVASLYPTNTAREELMAAS